MDQRLVKMKVQTEKLRRRRAHGEICKASVWRQRSEFVKQINDKVEVLKCKTGLIQLVLDL